MTGWVRTCSHNPTRSANDAVVDPASTCPRITIGSTSSETPMMAVVPERANVKPAYTPGISTEKGSHDRSILGAALSRLMLHDPPGVTRLSELSPGSSTSQ